jgi:hypothetical protein
MVAHPPPRERNLAGSLRARVWTAEANDSRGRFSQLLLFYRR